MAICHLEAKVISRGTGRSAVAASAYLSCTNILNDYDGVRHDFTRKKGLMWREVFLPEFAPSEWKDRGVLWNAVEENEKARDSRLAREFVPALPIELTPAQWQELLTDFIQKSFVAEGMCADVAIHDPHPPDHKPHAHIMLTVRPLDEQGKWQYKTEKEYLCIKDGDERGFTEQPTIHEGVVARALEAKGIISDRCELNRQIKADNALLRELKASVKKLMDAVKNTIPALAEAMESLRAKMIIFCYQLGHIRKGKRSISKYVDAADPILERYAKLKQEIKEKSSEQKSLHSEKKDTPVFHIKKHMELSQHITELTEDLEELRSERTMLLNQLNCTDDKEVKKVKTSVSNMRDSLKNGGSAFFAMHSRFFTLRNKSMEMFTLWCYNYFGFLYSVGGGMI